MKEEIINKLLEELKNNIPEDYVRSYDTSDGVGYYELDEDSWQYQVYHYIENLQSQLKAKEEVEKEFINYLEDEINKIKEQINNYDIWHEVGIDINFLILKKQFNIEILSKYKEILSKGENKWKE